MHMGAGRKRVLVGVSDIDAGDATGSGHLPEG